MADVDSAPEAGSPRPDESEDEKPMNSIQVSMDKTPSFYARIGERMLKGSPDKPAYDEVIVTGLGMATKTAIGAVSILERNNAATVQNIETSYPASTRGKRHVPKVTILLKKNPDEAGGSSTGETAVAPPSATTTPAAKKE